MQNNKLYGNAEFRFRFVVLSQFWNSKVVQGWGLDFNLKIFGNFAESWLKKPS